MPQIHITVPANSWTKEEKEKAAVALTETLAQVAADLNKGDIKNYVNVFFEETAEGGYVIGGQVLG